MSADLIIKIAVGSLTTNTTTNSAASIDIPQDGVIESVLMGINPQQMDATTDQVRIELSFGGTNSFDVNDARISIAEHIVSQNFLTSGGGGGGNTVHLSGLDIPVAGGERVHMHTVVSNGPTGSAYAYLYFRASGRSPARRSQRRR